MSVRTHGPSSSLHISRSIPRLVPRRLLTAVMEKPIPGSPIVPGEESLFRASAALPSPPRSVRRRAKPRLRRPSALGSLLPFIKSPCQPFPQHAFCYEDISTAAELALLPSLPFYHLVACFPSAFLRATWREGAARQGCGRQGHSGAHNPQNMGGLVAAWASSHPIILVYALSLGTAEPSMNAGSLLLRMERRKILPPSPSRNSRRLSVASVPRDSTRTSLANL